MDVTGYGVLTVIAVLIIAFSTFIWGVAVGDEHGGEHSKNARYGNIGLFVVVVAVAGFMSMLWGSSLHGSIGNVAHDQLAEGRYYVVSSAEWDEDTLALVLMGIKDGKTFNELANEGPRFHLVERDCFLGSPPPQEDDKFEVIKTKNARFCQIQEVTPTPSSQ